MCQERVQYTILMTQHVIIHVRILPRAGEAIMFAAKLVWTFPYHFPTVTMDIGFIKDRLRLVRC